MMCRATTLKMNPSDKTRTMTGSTFSPGDSSVYNLIIVLLLPPAPAARVLAGRLFDALSARSAAAFRRMAVFGPPGGVGDDGRAVEEPTDWGVLTRELGLGDDIFLV